MRPACPAGLPGFLSERSNESLQPDSTHSRLGASSAGIAGALGPGLDRQAIWRYARPSDSLLHLCRSGPGAGRVMLAPARMETFRHAGHSFFRDPSPEHTEWRPPVQAGTDAAGNPTLDGLGILHGAD